MTMTLEIVVKRGTLWIQIRPRHWELARVHIPRARAYLVGPVKVEWQSNKGPALTEWHRWQE